MIVPLWLAVAGLPVFQQPIAEVPDRPAAIAMVAGDVSLRKPCLRVRCADAEWRPPDPATTYAYRGDDQPAVRTTLPGSPTKGVRSLPAPRRQDWVAPYAGLDRVGGRYGRNLVSTPTTAVQVEVGTGFRWRPYVDNGSADTGPVARGRVALQQKVGEHARLRQETRVESGRDNTWVRNSLGVDIELQPNWSLRSEVEVRHDTAGNGGSGRTDSEGRVRLFYDF